MLVIYVAEPLFIKELITSLILFSFIGTKNNRSMPMLFFITNKLLYLQLQNLIINSLVLIVNC